MKKQLIVMLLAMLAFVACEKEDANSEAGGDESHNTGQNCLSCHASGNEYKFVTAGTVYQSDGTSPASTGQVIIYSEANSGGTALATIAVDSKGNFYSDKDISYSGGVYPVVSYSGACKAMVSPAKSGACNSCHDGNTTERISLP